MATLRYDKVGTGKTGLGPYAEPPRPTSAAPSTPSGAKAAVRFLADQPGTDKARISITPSARARRTRWRWPTDTDPGAPKIHSLGLLQPLTGRYLDLITDKVRADNAVQLKQGSKTQQEADGSLATWTAAVAQARTTGTVPRTSCPTD